MPIFSLKTITSIMLVSSLLLEATGTEAADCKEGGGYVLYANDHGKSDESGNLCALNLCLRNPELAYPLDMGETGVKEMTDLAFLTDGKLFGVTFARLVSINEGKLIAPIPDTDGMWGMISRDLCADRS